MQRKKKKRNYNSHSGAHKRIDEWVLRRCKPRAWKRTTQSTKKKTYCIRCTREPQQQQKQLKKKNAAQQKKKQTKNCLPFANKKWRKMCARMGRRKATIMPASLKIDGDSLFVPFLLGYSHCISDSIKRSRETMICIVCTKFSRCCESHEENAKKLGKK